MRVGEPTDREKSTLAGARRTTRAQGRCAEVSHPAYSLPGWTWARCAHPEASRVCRAARISRDQLLVLRNQSRDLQSLFGMFQNLLDANRGGLQLLAALEATGKNRNSSGHLARARLGLLELNNGQAVSLQARDGEANAAIFGQVRQRKRFVLIRRNQRYFRHLLSLGNTQIHGNILHRRAFGHVIIEQMNNQFVFFLLLHQFRYHCRRRGRLE